MNRKRSIRVLLVDDERAFVDTLARRLTIRNLQVNVAYDGEQALSRLQKNAPDVMVLDLKMPGIHGFEVLKRARAQAPLTQVVILTGHGSDGDAAIVSELGGFGLLRKPADIETLVRKICEASHASRAHA